MNVYYFDAYVRIEAETEEEAWKRARGETPHVCEADGADDGFDDAVQLVVTELLESEPVWEPECICPPELVARGGYRGGCPTHA